MSETLEISIKAVYENQQKIEPCKVHLTFGSNTYRFKVPDGERQSIDITNLNDQTQCTALIQKGIKFLAKADAHLQSFRRNEEIIFGFELLEYDGESGEGQKAIYDVELSFEIIRDQSGREIAIKDNYQVPESNNPFVGGNLKETPHGEEGEEGMQNFSKESFGDNDYNPENYRQEHDSPDRKAQVFINQMDAKISANSTLNGTIKNEFKELLNNLKTSIRDFETERSKLTIDTDQPFKGKLKSVSSPNFGSSPDRDRFTSTGRKNYQDEPLQYNELAQDSKGGMHLQVPKQNLDDLSKNYGQGGMSETIRSVLEEDPIVKNQEYLMTFTSEISAKTLGFVEDDFTRDIILQMSKGKRKVAPFYIMKSIQISEKDEIIIDKQGFFKEGTSKQYLHFFRPGTKKLYLFNTFKPVDPNYVEKPVKKDLDIDYTISPFHKSFIAPNGIIYVIGAKPVNHGESAEAKLLALAYKSGQLHEKQPIPNCKTIKDFGLCYLNRNIFIAGGVIDGHISNRFLRYDMRTNKWVELYGMPKKIRNAQICGFGTKNVFRFFGIDSGNNIDSTIERYDASRNRWFKMDVELDSHLKQIYLPMVIQVNPEAILVFGGKTIHDFPANSCKAYVFRTDEKKTPNEATLKETKNFIPGLAGNYTSNSLLCNLGEVSFLRETY